MKRSTTSLGQNDGVAQVDKSLDELREYRPERREPTDFDSFWRATIDDARSHPLDATFTTTDVHLPLVEVADASFRGFGGQVIRGWMLVPRHVPRPLPVAVHFVGYNGGRGLPYDHVLWPSAGYATFVMDTRGQGSGWSPGDTPDLDGEAAGPQFPGFLTRGIASPESSYYRRLFTDVVRAVEAARAHHDVDPTQTVVAGGSQGGAMALVAATLVPDVRAALIDVPFLCDIARAITITDEPPYVELARYLAVHRDKVDAVLRTIEYIEGMHFAARATVPALFSVGLMDQITPPSTVFAAYNHYLGPKDIRVLPYSGHDAGRLHHVRDQLAFLAAHGLGDSQS